MAAVGVMKKGMSMSLFSSPGHIVVAGQSGGGKSVPVKELIDRIIQKYKSPSMNKLVSDGSVKNKLSGAV
ncbi:hypothetical protein BANRA_05348 [Escherichia coli]|uniref:Conjugal transfer protein TrbD n=1 Tax=Escherichia coli TaxID=562 RepID=A0A3P5HAW2_ECOLX|nr:hypothetical protein BANRA_05348 [Escherichia coli]